MCDLYPFNAVMPLDQLKDKYKLHNNFLHINDKPLVSTSFKDDEGIKHIIDMIDKSFLRYQTQKHVYCCRITTPDVMVTGLLALMKVSEVGRSIFKHEKNIDNKLELYINYFQNHKIQTSPVILAHKNIEQIKAYLNNFTTNEFRLVSIKQHGGRYEIWKVPDTLYCQNLYNDNGISSFLIADGHHRIASLQVTNPEGYVMAFLVPTSDLKTARILRKYFNIDSRSKIRLFEDLNKYYKLNKLQERESEVHANKIQINIGGELYLIENSNSHSIKLKILELLDQHINYINGTLNFYNYHYNSNMFFSQHPEELSIHIPAHKVGNINNIKRVIYPPHSTLFYPKLPEGLVSFML
jgi:uncharacterized protein (DUF1015 family)